MYDNSAVVQDVLVDDGPVDKGGSLRAGTEAAEKQD